MNNPITQADVTQEISLIVQDKLAKANVTEQTLANLKAELLPLAQPVTNSAQLKLVQGGITKCVNYRGIITKLCKKGREAALAEQRAWIANEKELVALIKEIEDPLDAVKQAYLDEQARIQAEALEAQQRELEDRRNLALQLGFQLVDTNWVLEQTVVSNEQLLTPDPAVWATLKASMTMVGEEVRARKEAERLAAEAKAKELAEREEALRKQQEELERKQREMNERVNEVRKNELWALGCEEYETPSGEVAMGIRVDDGDGPKVLFGVMVGMMHLDSDESWLGYISLCKQRIKLRDQYLSAVALNEARVKELADLGEEVSPVSVGEITVRVTGSGSADVQFRRNPDALATLSDEQWQERLDKATTLHRQKQERAARQTLIQERVARLKEAGWVENGSEVDLFVPDGVHRMALDQIGTAEESTIADMVSTGQAELARRQAAQEEAIRQQAIAQEKARAEAERVAQAQELARQEAAKDDKTKAQDIAQAIVALGKHVAEVGGQMKSDHGREGMAKVKEALLDAHAVAVGTANRLG